MSEGTTNMNAVVREIPAAAKSVTVRLAERFGVDATKMLSTLKATAFRGNVSDEQLMALCVVADQYGLNPWTKEIYAFPSQGGAIIPVVGVDGWSRIINTHPQFDGMDFLDGEPDAKDIPKWIECSMHRKDRSHPVKLREYFVECYRDVGPWNSHPRRMLRHKATIQCARLAFGFAGIFDQDEAERIIDVTPVDMGPRPDTSEVSYVLVDKWIGDITDCMGQDKEEWQIAEELREINTKLSEYPDLYSVVFDQLAARKIITKGKFRDYLNIQAPK
jgi:phage recombination protein Bet